MVYKNSFFQIVIKNGTYLRVFPPNDSGTILDAREIADYLDNERIFDYNISAIHKAIENIHEITEIPISTQSVLPVGEKISIEVSEDGLVVKARFYPPSNGGSLLNMNSILQELKQERITYGIDENAIRQFLHKREYCTDIIIARGTSPRHGSDAYIEYHFDVDLKATPTLKEDGSVDFHHLGAINHIEKDALLATLHKADYGDPGTDVYGNHIKPRNVSNKKLRFGKNIYLSEDQTQIFSSIDGHVHLEEEKVFVSDTYEVLADVDASTGDIEYDGNVDIKGNVRTGFTVRATGDINVKGVVEGATLIAGGQVIIQRGIQGMNKGVIDCSGNVYAKFIENSEVKTRAAIVTEAIMHSQVFAQGDILVDGKKGLITGGRVCSRSMITMKTGGSDMGTVTKLEVGADPEMVEKCHKIAKHLPELQREMDSNQKIVDMYSKRIAKGDKLPPDKLATLKNAKQAVEAANEEFHKEQELLEHYQEVINADSNGQIKVMSLLYPGVEVTIADVVMHVRNEMKYTRLVRDGADIVVRPL